MLARFRLPWVVYGLLPVLLFSTLFLLTGCSQEAPPPAEGDEAAAEEAVDHGEEYVEETSYEEDTESVSAPMPKEMVDFPYEEIEITLLDNVVMAGRLYDPSQLMEEDETDEVTSDEEEEETAPSTQYPLVVLLHGLNGSHRDWNSLPVTLVKRGYAVLALDQRGHGISTRTTGGRLVTWRDFDQMQWKQMPKDLDRVLKYFDHNEDYPQVNNKKVALIGSKLGANVALIAANRHANHIKATIMLSPSLDYKGLETSRPMVDYRNALFIIASNWDNVSYEASELLYRWAVGPKAIQLYRLSGDGSDMIKLRPDLKDEMANWLMKYLPPGTPPKIADASNSKPAANL